MVAAPYEQADANGITPVPVALSLMNPPRIVPIVFANVVDPVGGGLVASMARPGGNATGFITHEFGFVASPSYNEVRTLGNKYAMFRIVAAEGPSQ
jgi:hypothetical protein